MNEFSIIARFFNNAKTANHANVVVANGDDSAVLALSGQQVVCTDTLVSGVHFFADERAFNVGWKSVAVNLSDLAAMGATPHSILLSISLPAVDEAWLADFAEGLSQICQQFNVQLIGGDTTRSTQLSITITAIGTLTAEQKAITRQGAQVGDCIAVSGVLGAGAYALAHYKRLQQLSTPNARALLQQLTTPMPQVQLGGVLLAYAHSMIDVSDGLLQDLEHLVRASKVAAQIDLHLLPVDPAILRDLDDQAQTPNWQQLCLQAATGGDDYQLCCTLSPHQLAAFNQQCSRWGLSPLTVIGRIVAATPNAPSPLTLNFEGALVTIEQKGYNHFS